MSQYGDGNITTLFGGTPFDPNAYEPSTGVEVQTPGKRVCLIESADLKDTKAGTGKLIKVVLKVLEGQFVNRKIFDNINISNPSEDCQRMGIAQFSALGRAAEVLPVNDTNDLVNKVVVAVIGVKKRSDTGEDTNVVRTYEHPSASADVQSTLPEGVHVVTTPAQPSPPAVVPTVPGAAGEAPWKR